jgi:hypothetical protein
VIVAWVRGCGPIRVVISTHGTVPGKVDSPSWPICLLFVTCNEQRDRWYMTQNMTCYRRLVTLCISYAIRSFVCIRICLHICADLYVCLRLLCTCDLLKKYGFSIVTTTVFFLRGPPMWCINLSTCRFRGASPFWSPGWVQRVLQASERRSQWGLSVDYQKPDAEAPDFWALRW